MVWCGGRGEVRGEEEMVGRDDIGHVERGSERNIIRLGEDTRDI